MQQRRGWRGFVHALESTYGLFFNKRRAWGHSLATAAQIALLIQSQTSLFIICSQPVLLLQGIVWRGNLSPPSISAFPLRCMPCLLLCFCIVPLRVDKQDHTLWIKMHPLWGRAHKTKPVRELWLQLFAAFNSYNPHSRCKIGLHSC